MDPAASHSSTEYTNGASSHINVKKEDSTNNANNSDTYDINDYAIDINYAANDNIDLNSDNTATMNAIPIKAENLSSSNNVPSPYDPSIYDPSVPSTPSPVPSPSSSNHVSSSPSLTPTPSAKPSSATTSPNEGLKRKTEYPSSTNVNVSPSRTKESEIENEDLDEDLYEGVPLSFTDRHSKAEEAKEKHMEQKWYE